MLQSVITKKNVNISNKMLMKTSVVRQRLYKEIEEEKTASFQTGCQSTGNLAERDVYTSIGHHPSSDN